MGVHSHSSCTDPSPSLRDERIYCQRALLPLRHLPRLGHSSSNMPRRLGSTVPATVSRLLQGGLISNPPAWFEAVGTVAPLRPSLTRKMPAHTTEGPTPSSSSSASKYEWKGSRKLNSNSSKNLRYRPPKPRPLPGFELHDKVRRTFFQDHPFEAFKGTSLVEFDGVAEESSKPGPRGLAWTELHQRSRNPSPDDAVDFVVNLHQAHELPLSLAYSSGVSQFRSLRASHEVALQAAQTEMQAYGHEWASEFSAIDRLARAEDRNLLEVLKDSRSGGSATVTVMEGTAGQSAAPTAAKGGSLLHPPQPSEQGWTKGVAYLHAGDKKGAGRTRKD